MLMKTPMVGEHSPSTVVVAPGGRICRRMETPSPRGQARRIFAKPATSVCADVALSVQARPLDFVTALMLLDGPR